MHVSISGVPTTSLGGVQSATKLEALMQQAPPQPSGTIGASCGVSSTSPPPQHPPHVIETLSGPSLGWAVSPRTMQQHHGNSAAISSTMLRRTIARRRRLRIITSAYEAFETLARQCRRYVVRHQRQRPPPSSISEKPPRGLEPRTCGVQNRCDPTGLSPAKGDDDAVCDGYGASAESRLALCLARNPDRDPALLQVVQAWPDLPEVVRRGKSVVRAPSSVAL